MANEVAIVAGMFQFQPPKLASRSEGLLRGVKVSVKGPGGEWMDVYVNEFEPGLVFPRGEKVTGQLRLDKAQ